MIPGRCQCENEIHMIDQNDPEAGTIGHQSSNCKLHGMQGALAESLTAFVAMEF